jgi:hypothetical protein
MAQEATPSTVTIVYIANDDPSELTYGTFDTNGDSFDAEKIAVAFLLDNPDSTLLAVNEGLDNSVMTEEAAIELLPSLLLIDQLGITQVKQFRGKVSIIHRLRTLGYLDPNTDDVVITRVGKSICAIYQHWMLATFCTNDLADYVEGAEEINPEALQVMEKDVSHFFNDGGFPQVVADMRECVERTGRQNLHDDANEGVPADTATTFHLGEHTIESRPPELHRGESSTINPQNLIVTELVDNTVSPVRDAPINPVKRDPFGGVDTSITRTRHGILIKRT